MYAHARARTHTHKGILLSHKKEGNNAMCSNTDLEIIILSEMKSDKGRYTISLIHEPKIGQMDIPMKQEQTHRHGAQTYGCQGGGFAIS